MPVWIASGLYYATTATNKHINSTISKKLRNFRNKRKK